MKNKFCIGSINRSGLVLTICIALLSACQSAPPITTNDIDSDVCIGEAVVVDPDKPVDLEEMAKQTDCE